MRQGNAATKKRKLANVATARGRGGTLTEARVAAPAPFFFVTMF